MTALKTNKSFKKRIKFTRTGKMLRRKPGQNHFLAKVSRKKQLPRKRWYEFDVTKKTLRHYLPYN